jgi:hypothetical protein
MTSLESELTRPGFDTIDLDVDVDAATDHVENAVKGLSRLETDGGVKYRTTSGMVVAIVAPRPTGHGDVSATLAYRTEPASASATRKASKILEALSPHEIQH